MLLSVRAIHHVTFAQEQHGRLVVEALWSCQQLHDYMLTVLDAKLFQRLLAVRVLVDLAEEHCVEFFANPNTLCDSLLVLEVWQGQDAVDEINEFELLADVDLTEVVAVIW